MFDNFVKSLSKMSQYFMKCIINIEIITLVTHRGTYLKKRCNHYEQTSYTLLLLQCYYYYNATTTMISVWRKLLFNIHFLKIILKIKYLAVRIHPNVYIIHFSL